VATLNPATSNSLQKTNVENKDRPKISIVSTLYCSSETIVAFVNSICSVARQITPNFEIVLIDDGSPDDSVEKGKAIDAPLKIISFTQNQGHHHAMMAATEHAKGEFVFLIDSDLEESPSLLLQFWKTLQEENDIGMVYGVQDNRKGNLSERLFGGLFYKCFNLMSDVKIPENLLTVRLMTRAYVEVLMQFKEKALFIGGLWQIAGFKQRALTVHKESTSATTYTLKDKLDLVLNAVTSFSSKPLMLLFKLSLLINLLTFIYITKTLYTWLVYEKTISGYASIIISIWMFGGLILSAISIVGLYLSKVFIEVKNRPRYSIKAIFDNSPF
jgi:putative glycosyltransferase